MYHNHAEFIPVQQSWFNVEKSVSVTCHINRLIKKKYAYDHPHKSRKKHLTKLNTHWWQNISAN